MTDSTKLNAFRVEHDRELIAALEAEIRAAVLAEDKSAELDALRAEAGPAVLAELVAEVRAALADTTVSTDDLLDVLTLGEIAEVEEVSGLSLGAMSDNEKPKGRLLIAMAYVAGKRTREGFTLIDAERLTGKGLNDVFDAIVNAPLEGSAAIVPDKPAGELPVGVPGGEFRPEG